MQRNITLKCSEGTILKMRIFYCYVHYVQIVVWYFKCVYVSNNVYLTKKKTTNSN